MGTLKAAKLETSPRLQRVYNYLKKCKSWRSTMQIINGAKVCAVNSAVSELRANGIQIDCRRRGAIWEYRLSI